MDVRSKTVLVTGANSGLGLETADALAAKGFRVLLTARHPGKGAAAADHIRRRHPNADVTPLDLDLSRLADVRRFATELRQRYPRLDVLVNNAGVMLDRRSTTPDGFETMFQVNHLGPFLLTSLLVDGLKESAPARIVTVSSEAHRIARLKLDDLQGERHFRGMRAYLQSKLCNILFTGELSRRLVGSGVTANSLHPGGRRPVRTRVGRDGDTHGVMAFGIRLTAPLLLSPAKGAATTVFLASSPDVGDRTGEHWVRMRPRRPSEAALDETAARQLWDISAELAGL